MDQPIAYLVVESDPEPGMLAPIVRMLKSDGGFDCRIICNDGLNRLDLYTLLQEPVPAHLPREPAWESLLPELSGQQAKGPGDPAIARRPDIVVFFGTLDPATGAVFGLLAHQAAGASHGPPPDSEPAVARKDPARYSAFLSAGMHVQRNDS
jgi:hypothetical protein